MVSQSITMLFFRLTKRDQVTSAYLYLSLFFPELFDLFQQDWKRRNPLSSEVDLQEFDNFIEKMPDLVIMLFDGSNGCFEAHSKGWIKQKAYEFLRITAKPPAEALAQQAPV